MRFVAGLQRVRALDAAAAAAELRDQGYRVYLLPGRQIDDRPSFFAAVRAALPLDPPVMRDRVWDALADSLWEGLANLDEERLAILWPDAAAMREASPDDFAIAAELLQSVAISLGDPRPTQGRPKQVVVVTD